MNPQWHDEFVALCALFPSGELTEEERTLLQVHLAYCDSCRVAFREYQQITNDVMPVMASSVYSELENNLEASSFSLEAAAQRLMSQLDFVSTDRESQPHRSISWRIPVGMIAACAVGVACLIGLHLMHSKMQSATQAVAVSKVEQPLRPAAPTTADTNLRPRLEVAQSEIVTLQQRLKATEDRYRQSSSTATNIEQQLEAEQGERKKINEERNALSQQLTAAQTEVQFLRDKAAASATVGQQTARTTALEAKLHELNGALDEKDRMLALDKEFLAHDREIRDLIGARNLYIADIYDVAQNGKTTKPFGRIFYTKDRSLVFYGYDLDKQAGLKQSVAFQAWGSGDDKQNVSLGLFYQDETHKRWMLRFNDTKTLARLNMVFVTAEPQGGSTKPTGKPLLLAYLQMQANHP
jgi:hypothetical protein